jgi:chorismate mutase/prephenate dehydratase
VTQPDNAGELGELRRSIDSLDSELLGLLAERRRLSLAVVDAKDKELTPLRDTSREGELLASVISAGRERGLDAHFVGKVFHEIIADSLRTQHGALQHKANSDAGTAQVRMAFQGVDGAFSQSAGQRFLAAHPGPTAFVGLPTFDAVPRAVEAGEVELGILPIENTTSGAINEVYDLLLHARVAIVGEVKLKIDHCLATIGTPSLGSLRRIYAHPQAAAQCSTFLASLPHCQVQYWNDTAESALKVSDDGDPTQAAIASAEAVVLYGLTVNMRGIANQSENFTRFVVIASKPCEVDRRVPCKTSIVMATGQQAGALVEALLVFRSRGINLAKLESRPILGNPWEEMFYIDFDGNTADECVQAALDELARTTRFVRVLGCYPSEDLPPTPVRITPPEDVADIQQQPAQPCEPAISTNVTAAKPSSGYRLASRTHKHTDTIVDVRGVRIGGDDFVVMAGPCAVESEAQINACARAVREHGGVVLRGGCFKPRSSPYSFQGLGWHGLELMKAAGDAYDLPIVTEVLATADVERIAASADILQIGARNMQNFPLLREVGRCLRPVLLKRGMMASIDELLQAAEYILAQGNQHVILCERGIRTFETATRNTLDLSAIPILRARTHLPIIVDPSHAAGERALVPPLARAAKAVGAHGIIVEVHPNPAEALSDGPQALTIPQLAALMRDLLGAPAHTPATPQQALSADWLTASGCG